MLTTISFPYCLASSPLVTRILFPGRTPGYIRPVNRSSSDVDLNPILKVTGLSRARMATEESGVMKHRRGEEEVELWCA